MRSLAAVLISMVVLVGCGGGGGGAVPSVEALEQLELTSDALTEGDAIPTKYTCDGQDVAPPLEWSETADAAQYVVVLDDPDAPGGGFLHWLVVLPASVHELQEGVLPSRAAELENDFGEEEYGGPCPPEGDEPHHYVFSVYAVKGGQEPGGDAREFLKGLQDSVLASGTLTAEYGR